MLGRYDGLDWINDFIVIMLLVVVVVLESLLGCVVMVLVGGFDCGVDWVLFVEYV